MSVAMIDMAGTVTATVMICTAAAMACITATVIAVNPFVECRNQRVRNRELRFLTHLFEKNSTFLNKNKRLFRLVSVRAETRNKSNQK